VFLETITAAQQFNEFIVFMELEASLPCTQETAPEFCILPDEFDPCPPVTIHYNEYLIFFLPLAPIWELAPTL
jgi:hypothetical protein